MLVPLAQVKTVVVSLFYLLVLTDHDFIHFYTYTRKSSVLKLIINIRKSNNFSSYLAGIFSANFIDFHKFKPFCLMTQKYQETVPLKPFTSVLSANLLASKMILFAVIAYPKLLS